MIKKIARYLYIYKIWSDNICNWENYITFENKQYKINLSRDINIQSLNINNIEPNYQKI